MVRYEGHDLNTDHGRFIYDLDQSYMLKERILLKELLRKRTLFIAKALP